VAIVVRFIYDLMCAKLRRTYFISKKEGEKDKQNPRISFVSENNAISLCP